MYLLYSFIAISLYLGVRSFAPGLFPFFAVGVPVLALLKDLIDEFSIRRGGSPKFYRYVEHNPFNFVLIGFILYYGISFGLQFPGFTLTENTAIFLSSADFLFDLIQDLKVELE